MMSGDIPYDAGLPAVWVYRMGYGKCPLLCDFLALIRGYMQHFMGYVVY